MHHGNFSLFGSMYKVQHTVYQAMQLGYLYCRPGSGVGDGERVVLSLLRCARYSEPERLSTERGVNSKEVVGRLSPFCWGVCIPNTSRTDSKDSTNQIQHPKKEAKTSTTPVAAGQIGERKAANTS